MAVINHCPNCNKDYIECEHCHTTFPTNVSAAQEVTSHRCDQRGDTNNTAKAAAAGAAGGVAAGTAGGLAVTAGAPAALGAAGFTSTGVASGSIAATLQGVLYGAATPAGGWFATCTSAAMGGAMGAAAVTAVAATGGVAVAAGAGYGIYKMIKKKEKTNNCPWCNRKDNQKISPESKTNLNKREKEILVEIPRDVENQAASNCSETNTNMEITKHMNDTTEKDAGCGEKLERKVKDQMLDSKEDDTEAAKSEFLCPVCADLMGPPARIYQCVEGHILCKQCRYHPAIKICPTCRGQFMGRNVAMEKIAKLVFK